MVLLGTMFWGTSGTASTYAPESATSLSITAVRLSLGAIGLLVLAGIRGRGRTRSNWPWLLTIIGAIAVAGGQFAFFAAVSNAGVAVSTVLTIGVAPIFAGLISTWYLGRRPDRTWAVATTLAIGGAVLMVLGAAFEVGGNPAGLLLGVLGGFGYAVYVAVSKKMIELGNDGGDVTAAICAGAALMLLPAFLLGDWHWVLEPRGVAVALYLGFATNAMPYFIFGLGLALIPMATAATLALMEPLTATLLGVIWLGERLTALQWLGVVLLFLGLLVLALPPRYRPAVLQPA